MTVWLYSAHMRTRGIVVGLALAATVTACGSAGGKTPVASVSRVVGVNTPADPVPSAASTTPSTAEQLFAWYSGGGKAIFTAMGTDLVALSTAATNEDSSGVATASVSLEADIDRAQAYAPLPSAPLQSEWSAGLASAKEAATDYITGANNEDASLIYAGTAALGTATSHLDVVTELIKSVSP